MNQGSKLRGLWEKGHGLGAAEKVTYQGQQTSLLLSLHQTDILPPTLVLAFTKGHGENR